MSRAEDIASLGENILQGLAMAKTHDVRAIRVKHEQSVCVVDSPIEGTEDTLDNPIHADAWASGPMDDGDMEQLRSELLAVFRNELWLPNGA